MKYVKTFENFTSQINEEEEILKSVRKLFGKESESDLAPLKEKFDAELANMEKQIIANMENPDSPIKVHLNAFDEDETEAKKETTFNGVVAPIKNYNSQDCKEKGFQSGHRQLLQVKFIQENGWFDYETGKYSTPEEMKGKELETLKKVWSVYKPMIQQKAKEEKYDGEFHKYSGWKLAFVGQNKVMNDKALLPKVYLSLSGEIFDKSQQAKGTYASGGFHR